MENLTNGHWLSRSSTSSSKVTVRIKWQRSWSRSSVAAKMWIGGICTTYRLYLLIWSFDILNALLGNLAARLKPHLAAPLKPLWALYLPAFGNLFYNEYAEILLSKARVFYRQPYWRHQKTLRVHQGLVVVMQEIGRGAYGVIYLAKQKVFPYLTRVIKRISKKKAKIPNFIAEIKVMSTLDHPHIIKLYETF